MAENTSRVERNVPGKWYVDRNCIGCGVCIEVASDNMEMDETEGLAFVNRQPANEGEEAELDEAAEQCPVEAIGSDG